MAAMDFVGTASEKLKPQTGGGRYLNVAIPGVNSLATGTPVFYHGTLLEVQCSYANSEKEKIWLNVKDIGE
jgi:hypothetical protein